MKFEAETNYNRGFRLMPRALLLCRRRAGTVSLLRHGEDAILPQMGAEERRSEAESFEY
jgi:hypothetical protein